MLKTFFCGIVCENWGFDLYITEVLGLWSFSFIPLKWLKKGKAGLLRIWVMHPFSQFWLTLLLERQVENDCDF